MDQKKTRIAAVLSVMLAALAPQSLGAQTSSRQSDGKVILANPDKYPVHLRFGATTRQIAPRKASVLSVKRFPITVEYFSGKKARGFLRRSVASSGVYVFRWNSGQWLLQQRPPRTAVTRPTVSSRAPSYRRPTGSYTRTVRGPVRRGPSYGYRPPTRSGWYVSRWPTWCGGVWGLMKLYQFARNEEDRELIRGIIVGREIDDAVDREVIDRELDRILRDEAVNLPADERQELETAIDQISKVDPDDWKHIATLPADEWGQLRDAIGDEFKDDDWNNLDGWVDTFDEPAVDDAANLDEIGIESMDSDLDLGQLDRQIDLPDADAGFGMDMDNVDLGDIAGDAGNLDLSDWDAGGLDVGDFDPGGALDAPGYFDDPGGLDLGGYDDGGFDFGGGYDDGGFDFGGGGFDDFGGGFDDFGGGFDDF